MYRSSLVLGTGGTPVSGSIEAFEQHLREAAIIDPPGMHHSFASDLHGQKVDFGLIPEQSPVWYEWVHRSTEFIDAQYPVRDFGHIALVGIANGTLTFASEVAERLGGRAVALRTTKQTPKSVALTEVATQALSRGTYDVVIPFDDVGTEGTTTLSAVRSIQSLQRQNPGIKLIEVVNTWQRQEHLPLLDHASITYRALINTRLATYTPEDCAAHGFCANGWQLIPHAAKAA
jgi:hypothetical protein